MDLPDTIQNYLGDERVKRLNSILEEIEKQLSIFIETKPSDPSNEASWSTGQIPERFESLNNASWYAGQILKRFDFICDKNKGMEWSTLAYLQNYSICTNSWGRKYEEKRSKMFRNGLTELATTEITSLKNAVRNIRLRPGYSVGDNSICPKLKALVSWMYERILVWHLCNNLKALFDVSGELQSQQSSHTPSEKRMAFIDVLALLFETIHQLSAYTQRFFPNELLSRGFSLRLIVCHMERHYNAVYKIINDNDSSLFTNKEDREAMNLQYYQDRMRLLHFCAKEYICYYRYKLDEDSTINDSESLEEIEKQNKWPTNSDPNISNCAEMDGDWKYFIYGGYIESDPIADIISSKSNARTVDALNRRSKKSIVITFLNNYQYAKSLTLYDMYHIKMLHKYELEIPERANQERYIKNYETTYEKWIGKLNKILKYYELLTSTTYTIDDVKRMLELHKEVCSKNWKDEYGTPPAPNEKGEYNRRMILDAGVRDDPEKPQKLIDEIIKADEQARVADSKELAVLVERIIVSIKALKRIGCFVPESIITECLREFYLLELGSLIRPLFDRKTSTYRDFMNRAENTRIGNNTTLLKTLENLKINRGMIAHQNTPQYFNDDRNSVTTYLEAGRNARGDTADEIIRSLEVCRGTDTLCVDIERPFCDA